MELATFSVVAMMREPPEVVRKFLDHYRGLGAERILLFHDGPAAALEGLDLSRVELVVCDAAFWNELCGGRPRAIVAAQEAVHLAAARRCPSAWMLVTDADEFLVADRPVERLLGAVPGPVEVLRIGVAEAVWGPGDAFGEPFACTHFRLPLSRRLSPFVVRVLYGRRAAFFRRGVLGHPHGKHFLRMGARVDRIGVHDSFREGRRLGVGVERAVPGARAVMAHFDAISFSRWAEKWRRRSAGEVTVPGMARERTAQMRQIEAAASAGAVETLFRRLYGLGRGQKLVLRALGALMVRDVFGTDVSRAKRSDAPPG